MKGSSDYIVSRVTPRQRCPLEITGRQGSAYRSVNTKGCSPLPVLLGFPPVEQWELRYLVLGPGRNLGQQFLGFRQLIRVPHAGRGISQSVRRLGRPVFSCASTAEEKEGRVTPPRHLVGSGVQLIQFVEQAFLFQLFQALEETLLLLRFHRPFQAERPATGPALGMLRSV